MVNYPETLPSDAIDTLINIIRTKSSNKEQIGLALWNLQGYAQSMILPVPMPKMYGSASPNPSDEEALKSLNTLKETPKREETDEPQTYPTLNPAEAMALKLLLQWCVNKLITIL
jgi:hypothetical protein